jgi:hypothetical protein
MGELARTLVVCGLISGTQPITLMGLLLVMTGNEPKRNGWAFLAGAFLVESTVLIGANLLVGGSVDSSSSTGRSLIIVKIVFGIALVLVGLRLRRPPRKPSPDVPPSLEKLRDLAPRKAFVAGLVLADYQGPFLASMALASASLSFSGRTIETHRKLTDKTSWVLKNRRKIASWVLIVAGIALVGDGIIAWLVVNA